MIQLTDEETLLLLTCRVNLSKAEDARLAAIVKRSPNWSLVLWRAETYQTLALIDYHLQRLNLQSALPDFIWQYIQNWTKLSQLRSQEQFRELGRIINCLQSSGIDYFILKGAALAGTIYPDPLLRPMQDLDIMILPRDAWRVQKAIYRLGFRHGVFNPKDGHFTHLFRHITWRSLRSNHALHSVTKTVRVPSPIPNRLILPGWRKRQLKSFPYGDETIAIPVFVDFHVSLSAGMESEDVWRGVQERLVLGQRVKVQSPTAMVWFSAARLYHEAFQHGTLKVQMFGDIDLILKERKNEVDWSELLTVANKYKLEPALYYVLTQINNLGSVTVPPKVLDLLKPDQRAAPSEKDWGDIMPKLLSRPLVTAFQFA